MDDTDARERRRLARLVDALPFFSGFVSPEGHLSQSRPRTDETFLWELTAFAYSRESITQIVDLFDQAANGARIQIERQYLKSWRGQPQVFARGLLTLTPIFDDHDRVEDIAVSLIDCDEAGIMPQDEFARTRLAAANARIDSMLSLAQTVIELSAAQEPGLEQAPRGKDDGDDIAPRKARDTLTNRLDALAATIDLISNPDTTHISVETLTAHCFDDLPANLRIHRLHCLTDEGTIPIQAIPIMALLLDELIDHARQFGAWHDLQAGQRGHVSIQSETVDTDEGRMLRLNWVEDSAQASASSPFPRSGFPVASRLFPEQTGGTAKPHMSPDGLSWTFELPVTDRSRLFTADSEDA